MLRGLFVLLNVPGLVLNIIDWEYFRFIGRRLSNEWHTIGGDIAAAGRADWWGTTGTWLLPLLARWCTCCGGCGPCPRAAELAAPAPASWHVAARGAGILWWWALVVLGLRGGWQLKPLRTGAAFEQQPAVLGHLALNSTFTVLKSVDEAPIERVHYFPSTRPLRPALDATPRAAARAARPDPPPNVVVLLLESFGSEYTAWKTAGRAATRRFSIRWPRRPARCCMRENYANGRRSIEALPAVLSGLPSLMDEPFITSSFQTAELHGLGEILGRHGYTTAMYHGGTNGTMGFDMFAGIAGMQHYYGLNQYPGGACSPDYDGHWGIFDEPYLQYFSRQLTTTRQPFFATLFTLSAHDPFTLPAQYKGQAFRRARSPFTPPLPTPTWPCGAFSRRPAGSPGIAHTLFVLTADHTSQSDQPGYQNPLGNFKTPLLLFRPGQPLPAGQPAPHHAARRRAGHGARCAGRCGAGATAAAALRLVGV